MFDPTQGRWMSLDPIEYSGNDQNLYRSFHNNPQVLVDPFGMDPPNKPGSQERAEWERRQWERRRGGLPTDSNFDRMIETRRREELVGSLRPNYGDATGQVYSHSDSVKFCCCSKSKDELGRFADDIFKKLTTFELFNANNMSNAVRFDIYNGPKGTHYAGFSLGFPENIITGDTGGTSSINAYVRLNIDEGDRTMAAQTLGNHPLVGVRFWQVFVGEGCVTVRTWAYDQRSGPLADKGFMYHNQGPDATVRIWRTYLQNIADHFKTSGCSMEFDKPESGFTSGTINYGQWFTSVQNR
jgi:hypothetical protein